MWPVPLLLGRMYNAKNALARAVVLLAATPYAITVGIQTATLLIFYGHPAHKKRAAFSFEFHFTITLTVILIYRTVTDPKN